MDLHIIITILGIFIGMVILFYGIISYDKIKKEESKTLGDAKEKSTAKEEIKDMKNEENGISLIESEKEDKKVLSTEEKKAEVKEKSVLKSKKEDKEISDFMDEEDFDNTLVLDKEDDSEAAVESVTEIPNGENIASDVEDLFD